MRVDVDVTLLLADMTKRYLRHQNRFTKNKNNNDDKEMANRWQDIPVAIARLSSSRLHASVLRQTAAAADVNMAAATFRF